MPITTLIALAAAACPSWAWDLRKDVEKLGRDIGREARGFGDKTGHELDNARRDVEGLLAGPFAPLSRDLPPGRSPGDDVEWMAVLGDSSVTGAVASPRFRVTVERSAQILGDVLIGRPDRKLEARVEDFKEPARFGIVPPIEKLTRVLYTRAEYDEAHRAGIDGEKLRLGSVFSQAFDTEEYAFPYLIGRALNIPAPRIVLAAQDGRKFNAMSEQIARVLSVPGVTRLPSLVIASFVANDLCHPDNFEKPLDHFITNFTRDVTAQFEALAHAPAAAGGTRLVLVAPFDVAEILTNPVLLDQHVSFENTHDATCRSIHDGSGVHGDVAKKLQGVLIGACRGILRPNADPVAHLARLREMQVVQRRVLRDAVAAFDARGLAIHAEIADVLPGMHFETGDAANDCFHPSPRLHERIAAKFMRTTFAH